MEVPNNTYLMGIIEAAVERLEQALHSKEDLNAVDQTQEQPKQDTEQQQQQGQDQDQQSGKTPPP